MFSQGKTLFELWIDEIRFALEHDRHLAALAMSLMLPDICGKAAFPEEKGSCRRYTAWINQNAPYLAQFSWCEDDPSAPKIGADVIYSLRCSVLHAGTPKLDDKQRKLPNGVQDENFVLDIRPPSIPGTMKLSSVLCSTQEIHTGNSVKAHRAFTYTINLYGFCRSMCAAAQIYYHNNKEKFTFFGFHIKGLNDLPRSAPTEEPANDSVSAPVFDDPFLAGLNGQDCPSTGV